MSTSVLVLMSTYNGEKFVEKQIKSIMTQAGEVEVSLLIRDDGSSDNTTSIIKTQQKIYHDRITLLEGKNCGSNKSFHFLAQDALEADFYSFSDQDDIWLPDKLSTAVTWLNKENGNVPLLYSSTSYVFREFEQPGSGMTRRQEREYTIYNSLIQTLCIGHNQVLNRPLLELIRKPIDMGRLYSFDSWVTNMAMVYGKVLFNNEPHTLYRQHGGNQMGYGSGKAGQLLNSFRHICNNEGGLYHRQIQYFIEYNEDALRKLGCYEYLQEFFFDKGFIDRAVHIMDSRIYRQTKLETLAFHAAYLIGWF